MSIRVLSNEEVYTEVAHDLTVALEIVSKHAQVRVTTEPLTKELKSAAVQIVKAISACYEKAATSRDQFTGKVYVSSPGIVQYAAARKAK